MHGVITTTENVKASAAGGTLASAEPRTPTLDLQGVSKSFGPGPLAVNTVDLSVYPGEFFSLLGPSGCGKTTILRMLAGFEIPTSGRIVVDGRDYTDVPPYRRDMSMVFQNYALFPHRTVAENVAFGLRMRRLNRSLIADKVRQALAMVALSGLENRKPSQLSGGQQQRVALARALVVEPKVLLCDEPLAALDKKLRQSMQIELKQLQQRLGVTLIFVTHDQEEALAMSDRLAVMNAGQIEQIGAPAEIYNCPNTCFVADFIGDTNLFTGAVAPGPEGLRLTAANGFSLDLPAPATLDRAAPVSAALRPEKVRLTALADSGPHKATGTIESAIFQGQGILFHVQLPSGQRIMARAGNEGRPSQFQARDPVALNWQTSDITLLWK